MNMRYRIVAGTLLAGCVAWAGSQTLVGQQSRKEVQKGETRIESKVQTETRTRAEMQILRSSLIMGSSVVVRGDVSFGEVHEFVFSPDGCVDFVIVLHEDRYFPVPWVVAKFDFAERAVILDVDPVVIQRAPSFTQFTEFNTTFVQKINTHFQVTDRSRPRPDRPGDRATGGNPVEMTETRQAANHGTPRRKA